MKIKTYLTLLLIILPQLSWGTYTISISASPATITVNSATAGLQPAEVFNVSTTYSCTTTTATGYITGAINTAMPTGTQLYMQLAAPSGATSTGTINMTTTAQNLVTGIPTQTTASGLNIGYGFVVTTSAAQVTNATKTLTLTIN